VENCGTLRPLDSLGDKEEGGEARKGEIRVTLLLFRKGNRGLNAE